LFEGENLAQTIHDVNSANEGEAMASPVTY
jgi:hypothetical protein